MCDCALGDAGAWEVEGALRVNTTLTHLSMHRNAVGDAGTREMAAALRVNTTLVNLALGGRWYSSETGHWNECAVGEVVKQELREVWDRRAGAGWVSLE